MDYGQLMIDLQGKELTSKECQLLKNPGIGGVILYARNAQDIASLKRLVSEIRNEATHALLIAVDHEGGRVWQFFEGFKQIPSAAHFGQQYQINVEEALRSAEQAGFTMASELHAVGIDLSFAPVLDMDRGISTIIGDRAFHSDPDSIVELATAFIKGMNAAGMQATGKHFPGHGAVAPDTHLEITLDARKYETLYAEDMVPFAKLIKKLGAIMPAHIIYSAVDTVPVGYSHRWLQEILRGTLKFTGAIISDCLSMQGAAIGGDYVVRARLALDAGCDMVMLCRQEREMIQWVLDNLDRSASKESQARLHAMSQLQAAAVEGAGQAKMMA